MKKGETAQRANIQKQKRTVQKLYHRIDQIRTDYINKVIAEVVKTKPSYITIEDLNVKGMMKNRHLSKAVASQKFCEFRTKLKVKCADNGIELSITCPTNETIQKAVFSADRAFIRLVFVESTLIVR